MTTVADLRAWMERFAPKALAESWDNVGLLMGDPDSRVERVMTCLTVTATTAAEAVEQNVDAIVSHHPVLFRPIKSLLAHRPETSFLWRLARAGIAVMSPHTSFDNTEGGINDGLARRFGLINVLPLRVQAPGEWLKVVVYAPVAERETLLRAAFEAGAGQLGEYSECSFGGEGIGTFRGSLQSHPTIGKPGERESVVEFRIEFLCPAHRRGAVVEALHAAHSYEEPAIDVIRVEPTWKVQQGSGRVGDLASKEKLGQFAARVGSILQAPGTQFVGNPDRLVGRVAICCGAGDEFLTDAHQKGADVYLTGEARYHKALEAESLGMGLIVAGHHATERPGVEDLAKRIMSEFPNLEVWASRSESDPLRSISVF